MPEEVKEELKEEETKGPLQKLKDKILAKESWQIENTKLGILIESELRKIEHSEIIKESFSIKDRFSKLI